MLKVTSPYDLSLIKEIPLAGKDEVERTLATANNLFLNQSKWLSPHERIAILQHAATII